MKSTRIVIALLLAILSVSMVNCSAPDDSITVTELPKSTDDPDEETDDTDTPSDTVSSLVGEACSDALFTCDQNQLLACEDSEWILRTDCAAEDGYCENYGDTYGVCQADWQTATGLTLTPLSVMTHNPAGIRVVFSVAKNNGVPISRLTASEIVVINNENGLQFNEGGGAPVIGEATGFSFYTVLALDMSDSMFTPAGDNNAMKAIAAAKLFVKSRVEEPVPAKKHHVAIYAFGSTTQSLFFQDFTNDHDLLNSKLDSLFAAGSRGGTNLYGAYLASLEKLYRVVYPTVEDTDTIEVNGTLISGALILLSDGLHESGNKAELRTEALAALEKTYAEVYTIGMEGDYNEDELRELASNPSSNYFSKEDTQTLDQKFEQIAVLTEIMADSNYVVGVCSPVESASTFTITATRDDLIGALTVEYGGTGCEEDTDSDTTTPPSCWTGDVSQCDESEIANL